MSENMRGTSEHQSINQNISLQSILAT